MKTIFLAMTAVSALAVAAPAAAQYRNDVNAGMDAGMDSRIAQLEMRLQAGIQQGSIDRREAYSLRTQLRQLRMMEGRYARDGFNGSERADLQQRMRAVRQQMNAADGGAGYGRNDYDDGAYGQGGYGQSGFVDRNNDGYDDRDTNRDGRSDDDVAVQGNFIDRNNDGYDDRDTNRNGRWNDDAATQSGFVDRNNDGYDDRDTNRDGRYRQADNRDVVDRAIDSITGGGRLRVGERVSGNLGAVPYAYRDQYRDSRDYYYRSDGRAIYQIDARTDTVVRIYATR